jgi:hypothetical protein
VAKEIACGRAGDPAADRRDRLVPGRGCRRRSRRTPIWVTASAARAGTSRSRPLAPARGRTRCPSSSSAADAAAPTRRTCGPSGVVNAPRAISVRESLSRCQHRGAKCLPQSRTFILAGLGTAIALPPCVMLHGHAQSSVDRRGLDLDVQVTRVTTCAPGEDFGELTVVFVVRLKPHGLQSRLGAGEANEVQTHGDVGLVHQGAAVFPAVHGLFQGAP